MSFIEKEVLGCFLKDNTLLKETTLQKHYFKDEAHQVIYESMQKLIENGKAVDKVTLLAENYEYFNSIGGVGYITQLEANGLVENFESYESKTIENFKQRESEKITNNWLASDKKDNQQLISDLQKLDDIGFTDESDKNVTLQKLMLAPEQEIDHVGIMSGLLELDKLLGGFQNQQSYILGARPSMGKTATMLKFLLSAAEKDAVPVIFSLEMSEESLLKRLIATVGKINLFLTKNPYRLSPGKKYAWKEAVDWLYKRDFEIYDKPLQTIQYIRSKVRKERSKHKGKQIIVMIDYLTLIDNSGNFYSDHAKVSDISARLKGMAKEFDCPVITLAQLSRSVESRQDKRPMLSDLRESGSIEQDADVVMFLYRDSYYNAEAVENVLEIIVAKHRDGPTGKAEVYYNKSTGIMGDLSDY